jgi:hypothetical protein
MMVAFRGLRNVFNPDPLYDETTYAMKPACAQENDDSIVGIANNHNARK